MTDTLVVTVLVILGVWLLVLSVLFAAVVRHLGTMQAAMLGMTTTGTADKQFDFRTDGPELMSEVPLTVRDTFASNGIAPDSSHIVLFFSSSCDPCIERAEEFSKSPAAAEARLIVLASGTDQAKVEKLRELLGPLSDAFIVDPLAYETVHAMNIQSTPFAFRMVDGKVVDKGYVRSVAVIEDMVKRAPAAVHN